MHRPEQRCVRPEGSRQGPGKQAWLGGLQVKGDLEAAAWRLMWPGLNKEACDPGEGRLGD